GICGGYQMMGGHLSDPDGVESGGELAGLGLLPTDTVFYSEKTRTRVSGSFTATAGLFETMKEVPFEGYEIHMGRTTLQEQATPLVTFSDGDGQTHLDGAAAGNVWGCYVHGIFDRAESAGALVNCLRRAKGLADTAATMDWADYKELQYDKLAAGLRSALDMEQIYRILEEGE
ncbi:MAG: cobyric acid synthase CobQ, partial [Oscillospiraceae bacterium]